MSYTYFHVEPSARPPFTKTVKRTRGKYDYTTEKQGPFGFRYAVFRNRSSVVFIPLHDLTPETKEAIAKIESERPPKVELPR